LAATFQRAVGTPYHRKRDHALLMYRPKAISNLAVDSLIGLCRHRPSFYCPIKGRYRPMPRTCQLYVMRSSDIIMILRA